MKMNRFASDLQLFDILLRRGYDMENFVDAGGKAGEVGWTVKALDIEVNIER